MTTDQRFQNPLPLSIALIILATMIVAVGWSIMQLQPARVLPIDRPLDQFSALRAGRHLEVIAGQPRPTGSAGNRLAQDYIVKQLTELGIETSIDRQTVTSTRWGMPFDSALVGNIIAKLPASSNGNADSLLLVCHYDSVPNSPGAADNGSGVAALLETARALKLAGPLKNQILLLFTDAEESGALGAKAFIEHYPQLNQIKLVLNFDARGNRGSVGLIETTNENGYLIREFARAAPQPIASSAFFEVVKLLGQSTDFRPFREAGLAGYNFIICEGITYYPTPIDNINNLDKGSLQQEGEYALSLARHFGNLPLANLKADNLTYFNFAGYFLSYPQYLTLPLLALNLLLFVVTLFVGWRYSKLKVSSILFGIGLFIGILLVTAVLVTALNSLISATSLPRQVMRTSDTYNVFYYRLGYILFGIGVFLALQKIIAGRISALNFAVSVASIWLILLTITSLKFPGLSYIFSWPLLLNQLAILLFILLKELRTPVILAVTILTVLPVIFIVTPIPYLILVAIQLARANVAVIFVGLSCGLLSIYWQLLLNSLRWYLPVAMIIIATGLIIIAGITSGFNDAQPRPTSLAYFLDTTAQQAYWLSEDRRLNSYISQFIPAIDRKGSGRDLFPDNSLAVSRSVAPVLKDLDGPMIRVLADQTENGRRSLKLAVSSARNAQWLFVFVTSPTQILSTAINGQVIKDPIISQPVKESCWGFRHMNISAAEVEWTLEVKASDQPLEIVLIDQSFSLPDIALTKAQLPADMMIARSWIANSTLVRTRVRF